MLVQNSVLLPRMVTLSYCQQWAGFKVHCWGRFALWWNESLPGPLTQFLSNWTKGFWCLAMAQHQLYCFLYQHLHNHWGWERHLKSACFVLVGGEILWLTNTRIHNYYTNTKYKETITNTQSQLSGPEERLLCGGGLGATLLAEAPSSKSRLSWSLSWLL